MSYKNPIFRLLMVNLYWIIQGLLLTGAIFITILLSYLFDQNITGKLTGGDAMSAYTYVIYLNKYFPNIPFWYPQQGAGISFTAGYQWLGHYLVVLTHRISGLDLVVAFNLVRFASYVLSAIGIIFLCYCRLHYPKQRSLRILIGLIAVYFYLISPITRYWSDKWGFFAEGIANMFVAPAIIFLDWYAELAFKRDQTWRKRVALIGSSIFFALAFHTHFMVGLGIAFIFFLIILFKTIRAFPALKMRSLQIGFLTVLWVFTGLGILFGWRYAQFMAYTKELVKGGQGTLTLQVGPQNLKNITAYTIPEGNYPTIKQIMQIESIKFPDARSIFDNIPDPKYKSLDDNIDNGDWLYMSYSAPFYVWFFMFIGLFLGWIRSRKILLFGLVSLWALYVYSPHEQGIFYYFIRTFENLIGGLQMFLGSRPAWSVARLIVPITAAYGAFILVDLPLLALDYLIKKASPYVQYPWTTAFRPSIIAITTIFLTINIIYSAEYNRTIGPFKITSPYPQKKYLTSKPNIIYLAERRTDLNNIWNNPNLPPNPLVQLSPKYWPRLDTKDTVTAELNDNKTFNFIRNEPLQTRMDISGYQGTLVMQAPLLTDVSQTQAYINNLVLFSGLQNFQTATMYVDYPIYQKNNILNELSNWFGYEYVFAKTNSQAVQAMYQENSDWEYLDRGDWYRYKKATGLATWTTRPNVLFIGNESKLFYDQFFKNNAVGALSYQDAISFSGGSFIDDFKLEDLTKFQLIVLSGYNYHNHDSAFDLLDKYAASGGSIFIDTGWQYNNPEWEGTKLPKIFPTNAVSWKTVGIHSKMTLDKSETINYRSDAPDIGDLAIAKTDWGISGAEDVRTDSQVLLQSSGTPIVMAKKHGKGKVIWSGLNIIAHIEGNRNDNQKEIEFLNAAYRWLLNSKQIEHNISEYTFNISRIDPDHLQFKANDTVNRASTLYWREAYHPKWKAQLISRNQKTSLKIYRAGPRFMGLRLPAIQKGDIIKLSISPTSDEILITFISVLGLIALFSHLWNVPAKIWSNFAVKFSRRINASRTEVIKESRRNTIIEETED